MSGSALKKVVSRFRVSDGKGFRLNDFDPGDTAGLDVHKPETAAMLAEGVEKLAALQPKLTAQGRWSVLVILQAMDAAGKDGAIKHVFSGLNPQGCEVFAFKAPSTHELEHDFLWRHIVALPERGRIGIHNRSWYEEVLVARVHAEVLARQKLPDRLVTEDIWDERLQDIAAFERYLARQGTIILKFFLNVSKAEQRERFLARIDDPDKNWKFSSNDIAERQHWKAYRHAYEAAIAATASKHAPWYVVPADHKPFTRMVVAGALVAALESLDLRYPEIDPAEHAKLLQARQELTK